MQTKLFMAAALSLAVATTALAQDKIPVPPPSSKSQNEEIIIKKKKADKDQQMTIVINGDSITVNGKPIDKLSNEDIQIIKGNADAIRLHGKLLAPNAPYPPMMIKSDRAFLGVSMDQADNGAKVTEVSKESAAEKAGIKVGDIITKVGTTKITSAEDVQKAIGSYKPNDEVSVTLLRNGKEQKVNAKLQTNRTAEARVYRFNNNDFDFDYAPHFNEDFFSMSKKPRLGMTIQDVEEGSGVKVIGVEENSVASKAGLQKEDVVTKINDKDIKSVDEFRSALKDVKEGDTFSVQYNRKGTAGKTEIKFPKKLKTANL